MWNEVKRTLISIIVLPFLIVGYIILLLFSIIIPPKYSMRLFNVIAIEKKISSIINHPTNLIILSFIITLIVYITYIVS